MEIPLIWTSKGNLPVTDLEERVVWTDNPDETILAHEHWLGDECVKRSVHVYKRTGVETLSQIGAM